MGTNTAQGLEAADAGQHDVQYYHLVGIAKRFVRAVNAVVYNVHRKPLRLQILLEHAAQLDVVIHQQHSIHTRNDSPVRPHGATALGVRGGVYPPLHIFTGANPSLRRTWPYWPSGRGCHPPANAEYTTGELP